jgi:uncharacterized membrane protein YfcA
MNADYGANCWFSVLSSATSAPGPVWESIDPARSGLGALFGLIVGIALGLTGGGGSIFAVPLLMYAMGVSPTEAIGISLLAVGLTALSGALQRARYGELELATGLIFAAGGILGAPLGTWIRGIIPESMLLISFAGLMLLIAHRMWHKASRTATEARALGETVPAEEPHGACRRDPAGRLKLSTPCALQLAAVGFGTGILSGLFGVGGGFVIVPALVFFSGMGIHRAVATSLLAIALICASGVWAHVASHKPLEFSLSAAFVAGGMVGMYAGTALGRKLSGPILQRIFAIAIVLVACFIVLKTTLRF